MACFVSIENGLRSVGRSIGRIYHHPAVLALQAALAFVGGVTFGVLMELKKSPLTVALLIVFAVLILLDAAAIFFRCYRVLRKALKTWAKDFKAMNAVLTAAGFTCALKVFVALSSEVEEAKKLNLYAVGLMICIYVCLATVVKLFGGEDLFGICDGVMALTILAWVTMPISVLQCLGKRNLAPDSDIPTCIFNKKKNPEHWAFVVFYFTAFLLTLFKTSEVTIRGFEEDGAAPPSLSETTIPSKVYSGTILPNDKSSAMTFP